MAQNKTTEQRFWEKVNRTDGCWLWTAARLGRATCNYGVFRSSGRSELAHRISYKLNYGDIPNGMNVLHRCDNPICVNPEHLFLGTQADNIEDMRAKGRARSATERPERRKLSADVIQSIRDNMNGYSQRTLARMYAVNQRTIWNIRHHRSWADK